MDDLLLRYFIYKGAKIILSGCNSVQERPRSLSLFKPSWVIRNSSTSPMPHGPWVSVSFWKYWSSSLAFEISQFQQGYLCRAVQAQTWIHNRALWPCVSIYRIQQISQHSPRIMFSGLSQSKSQHQTQFQKGNLVKWLFAFHSQNRMSFMKLQKISCIYSAKMMNLDDFYSCQTREKIRILAYLKTTSDLWSQVVCVSPSTGFSWSMFPLRCCLWSTAPESGRSREILYLPCTHSLSTTDVQYGHSIPSSIKRSSVVGHINHIWDLTISKNHSDSCLFSNQGCLYECATCAISQSTSLRGSHSLFNSLLLLSYSFV